MAFHFPFTFAEVVGAILTLLYASLLYITLKQGGMFYKLLKYVSFVYTFVLLAIWFSADEDRQLYFGLFFPLYIQIYTTYRFLAHYEMSYVLRSLGFLIPSVLMLVNNSLNVGQGYSKGFYYYALLLDMQQFLFNVIAGHFSLSREILLVLMDFLIIFLGFSGDPLNPDLTFMYITAPYISSLLFKLYYSKSWGRSLRSINFYFNGNTLIHMADRIFRRVLNTAIFAEALYYFFEIRPFQGVRSILDLRNYLYYRYFYFLKDSNDLWSFLRATVHTFVLSLSRVTNFYTCWSIDGTHGRMSVCDNLNLSNLYNSYSKHNSVYDFWNGDVAELRPSFWRRFGLSPLYWILEEVKVFVRYLWQLLSLLNFIDILVFLCWVYVWVHVFKGMSVIYMHFKPRAWASKKYKSVFDQLQQYSTLASLKIVSKTPSPHSHPSKASDRNDIREFVTKVLNKVGRKAVFDVFSGSQYSSKYRYHNFYTVKDVGYAVGECSATQAHWVRGASFFTGSLRDPNYWNKQLWFDIFYYFRAVFYSVYYNFLLFFIDHTIWHADLKKADWFKFVLSDFHLDVTGLFKYQKGVTIATPKLSKLSLNETERIRTFNEDKLCETVDGGGKYVHTAYRYDQDYLSSEPSRNWFLRLFYWLIHYEEIFVYKLHRFMIHDYEVIHMIPHGSYNYYTFTPGGESGLRLLETSYEYDGVSINALCIQESCDSGVEKIVRMSYPNSDTTYTLSFDSLAVIKADLQAKPDLGEIEIARKLYTVFKNQHTDAIRASLKVLVHYLDIISSRMYINSEAKVITTTSPIDGGSSSSSVLDPFIQPPKKIVAVDYAKVELEAAIKGKFTRNQRKEGNDAFNKWLSDKIDNFVSSPDTTFAWMPSYNVVEVMRNIFPLIIPGKISAPARVSYFTEMDAVVGRCVSVNKDTLAELLGKEPILKTVKNIIPHIFEKLLPLNEDQLAELCDGAKNLRMKKVERDIVSGNMNAVRVCGTGTTNFFKVELQTKDKATHRSITNENPISVIEMMRFVKPLSRYMSKFPGYAFGQSAEDLANHIHTMCKQYDSFVETDYSAYDGTQNSFTAAIEHMIYDYVFDGSEMNDLKEASWATVVKGKGFSYKTFFTRHSGAADTSLMNTIVNMIVTTLSRLYEGKKWDQELKPGRDQTLQCFNKNIAGGDDGLAFDIDADHYEKFTKHCNLELKAAKKQTSSPLNMLARIYPNPRFSNGSGPDFKRVFSKLTYTSCGAQFNEVEALYLKIQGLLICDFKAPLFSESLTKLSSLLVPYLTNLVIKPMMDVTKDIAYAARLGQPPQVEDEDSYFSAQDPDALTCVRNFHKAIMSCEKLTDLKVEIFKVSLDDELFNRKYDNVTVSIYHRAQEKVDKNRTHGVPDLVWTKLDEYATLDKGKFISKLTGKAMKVIWGDKEKVGKFLSSKNHKIVACGHLYFLVLQTADIPPDVVGLDKTGLRIPRGPGATTVKPTISQVKKVIRGKTSGLKAKADKQITASNLAKVSDSVVKDAVAQAQ